MQTNDLQELALVIAVENLDPTLLSPEFLHYSNLVPADWQLARTPIRTPQLAQIIFQNGISLIAQANRLTFVEPLVGKANDTVEIAQIAGRFVTTLPNLAYRGVGINTRVIQPLSGLMDNAQSYLSKTLLVGGEWQSLGSTPVKVGLNLSYTFDNRRLNLTLNEAVLQLPEQAQIPVVIFCGNFDYDLTQNSISETLSQLQHILQNWSADLDLFCKVVSHFPQTVPNLEPCLV
jgi:hypothetical protein